MAIRHRIAVATTMATLGVGVCFSGANAFAKPAWHPPTHPQSSPTPASPAPTAVTSGTPAVVATPEAPEKHGPINVHVTALVTAIGPIDGDGTTDVELLASLRCDAEPCRPVLDVANGHVLSHEVLSADAKEKRVRVRAEIETSVDLAEFPFDEPVVTISLADREGPGAYVYDLDRTASGVDRGAHVSGFEVVGWASDATSHNVGGTTVSDLDFFVKLHRLRGGALTKTFAPAFFALLAGCTGLLFGPKMANTRIAVAFIGFLAVGIALAAGMSPALATTTVADKLLVATSFVALANIGFAVAIAELRRRKASREADLAHLVAAGCVPGVAVVVFVAVLLRMV